MICKSCTIDKPHTIEYYTNAGNGKLGKTCRICRNTKERAKYASAPKEKIAKDREYRLRMRKQVIDQYGGKCVVCGNNNINDLQLDHIHGNGYIHRRNGIKSMGVYRYAINNNYPDDLQILCWRCNMAKGQGSTQELIDWIIKTAKLLTDF